MGYRLGWLAALSALLLALGRMGRLLESATDGPPWELALAAAAVLGATITWTAISYGLGPLSTVALNAAGFVLAASRIAAPDTTRWLLPTPETFTRLGAELTFAFTVLRHGTAPVLPVAGLVVLSAAVFWSLGAVTAWGFNRGHPYLALVPTLLFYLQLSVIDHRPSGSGWALALLLVTGGGLAALAAEQRRLGSSELRRTGGSGRPSWSTGQIASAFVAGVALLTLWLAGPVAEWVPRSGLITWRSAGGIGGGYFGSLAYNPFVGIRQSLVSQGETEVFTARVEGDVQPAGLYWRLITLDAFNGTSWYATDLGTRIPNPGAPWEDPDLRFFGPTAAVTQDITIQALSMDWLPALYAPVELSSAIEVLQQGLRVREDGSLRFDALTFPGLQYRVQSRVPVPDSQMLASLPSGDLSPIFAQAVEEGVAGLGSGAPAVTRHNPPELDHFLELPEDLDPKIITLAGQLVRGATTEYERALLLESWFRDPNQFTYSTDVASGHSAVSLAGWLLDPESPNYRTGYCEQFATSLAVLARAVGIPSRAVLGFTPGEPDGQGGLVVRDRNAHAWVELWMPSQGWVRFDPTPRGDGVNPATVEALDFDPRRYAAQAASSSQAAGEVGSPELEPFFPDPGLASRSAPSADPGGGLRLPRIRLGLSAWPIVALAVAAAGLPAYKWWRRRRRLARLAAGDVTAAWEEIIGRLADLGEEVRPDLTPAELAEATTEAMGPLAAVYGEVVYGPPRPVPHERVEQATRAMQATETRILERHSRLRKAAAWYRLRSLRRR